METKVWGFGKGGYWVEGPCSVCGEGDGRVILAGNPPVWTGTCCIKGDT